MNTSKFLPFENYMLVTKLTTADVCRRIEDNVQPKKVFNYFSRMAGTKPYQGEIDGHSFSISRIIDYRNSFLPIIKGRVSSYSTGTQIKIKMRPHTFIIIFISFWLGIVGLICLAIIIVGLLNFEKILMHGHFSPMILIPFGMFAFGWALTFFSFKAESKRSKEFFQQLFEATESNEE